MGKVFVFLACFLFASFAVEAQQPGSTAQSTAMQSYRRGRDLEAMNRMSDANIQYNEAVRLCLDEVNRGAATGDTYTVITWTMRRQRKYGDVISWGERGLRLFPNEFRIIEIMGEAHFYLNDYEKSLTCMQRYTNAMPQGELAATAYFFIGEMYRLTGKLLHADIAYTTAVRFAPSMDLWWFRLASVREQAGDRTPALEAYRQALRLNPNYREARDGVNRLQ